MCPIGDMLKTTWRGGCDESSQGEGDPGGWGVVSHFFDFAIHKRTNQCEVFGVLFIVDKTQTGFNM